MAVGNEPSKTVTIIIIGSGGIGHAVASSTSAKETMLLVADASWNTLDKAVYSLRQQGHEAEGHLVVICDRESLHKLAQAAQTIGTINAVVLTAALSPASGTSKQILRVNLVGTAKVIEVFAAYAEDGSLMVCIASMAGSLASLSTNLEQHLAIADTDHLLDHQDLDAATLEPHAAYTIAKRADQLRVQASAHLWASRGARLDSVSPGVISTVAGNLEMGSARGAKRIVELSALGKPGLPEEIGKVVAFFIGPHASFITGTDILVDGGAVAGYRWSKASK
jgi:NAD(P)-dependent dehydrogenase (short-subunit alcohol dehydrogenase family)